MEGRRRLPQIPETPRPEANISEPELDMCRQRPSETSTFGRVRDIIRTLMSGGHAITSPMRSVARELEESWPTGES
jgi:hypothetical protein